MDAVPLARFSLTSFFGHWHTCSLPLQRFWFPFGSGVVYGSSLVATAGWSGPPNGGRSISDKVHVLISVDIYAANGTRSQRTLPVTGWRKEECLHFSAARHYGFSYSMSGLVPTPFHDSQFKPVDRMVKNLKTSFQGEGVTAIGPNGRSRSSADPVPTDTTQWHLPQQTLNRRSREMSPT